MPRRWLASYADSHGWRLGGRLPFKVGSHAGEGLARRLLAARTYRLCTNMGYLGIGYILGSISAVLTFIGAYIYCVATYGFLLGLGLGWLPSGILAMIVFWAMAFLWGPALLLIALAILVVWKG